MESDLFSDREKAAILWAEHVTKNTARSRDDVYETVRAQFSEAEMVELTMMSGLFNFYNRFMDSLGVPLEIQGEVDKIKRSVNLDPARVKQYMQTLIDNWPDEFPTPNPDVT
ncbi:MAG: carboxymuconolactone decarboxylase family protein [Rhodospirillaceae bacterium]|jgi:hypothetical protein|nr:carboxymuconolactone decarboxylase family protein [Rhodospirillales bacterium]MBT3904985.1 carboxymuconolactone decarboxylase family protein [Rhodospirillaceae bacterium]MBT4702067.1 carboxymuconolactone decarboxylase family protein [Rhodospirillaceae bacterium]MBT5034693.1 carboxymuconolactone decarboxylase family protein [Rhodospirillaceae bacterium]MBT6222063.1 carboxymuconolactone decarboxylase family protein [Rhodospirillaceae bacterium]